MLKSLQKNKLRFSLLKTKIHLRKNGSEKIVNAFRIKEKSDEELIKESIGGSLASFEVLVRRYQEMILRYCQRTLKDAFDAEDATQETFLKVFTNLGKFDQTKPFRPWIYKIAHNASFDILREKSRVTSLTWDVEYQTEPTINKIIKHEQKMNILTALKGLPIKYKIPLVEFYFKSLDYKQISEKLGLPLNTIRTRIRRGKLLLAEAIE